jgi:hypothetical protein
MRRSIGREKRLREGFQQVAGVRMKPEKASGDVKQD